jgi:undecaprenyl-diphosphatase
MTSVDLPGVTPPVDEGARPSARRDGMQFAIGTIIVVAAGAVAHGGTVGSIERGLFRAVNRLPDWLHPIMWPLQQAGNLLAGMVVAVVAALCRRTRLALAAVLVTLIDVESYVKLVITRQRPGTTVTAAITRGDVPTSGLSFPSGHAVLVTSLAVIVAPELSRRWRWIPWALVVAVALGRIYVGAHNVADVVGGIGLGLTIGVVVRVAISTSTTKGVPS